MNYHILYFASLRDAAGCDSESCVIDSTNAREVYAQLRQRHGFSFESQRLRLAVNGEFTTWDRPLAEADEIAFLPPVSGG